MILPRIELVENIPGIKRPVTAAATFTPPTKDAFGGRPRLRTRSCRGPQELGKDWQMPLPAGGDALGWPESNSSSGTISTGSPAYNEDVEIQQESVALLKDETTRADAVLFATPEYNASVPGSLKNALDWISRPFADNPLREKRVAVIGASKGAFGAAWAQAESASVLQALGASVEQRELAVPHAQQAFAADGLLRDPEQRAMLTSILEALRGQNPRQPRRLT